MTACKKVRFKTQFEARAKAMWLWMTKPHKFPEAPRVYACSNCMRWHLTHTKKDPA